MRYIKKLLATLLVLFTSLMLVTNTSSAASAETLGLSASLSTDKNTYSKDEIIDASLFVSNNRESDLTNVSLRMLITSEFEIIGDGKDSLAIERLKAKDSVTLSLKLKLKNPSQNSSNPSEPSRKPTVNLGTSQDKNSTSNNSTITNSSTPSFRTNSLDNSDKADRKTNAPVVRAGNARPNTILRTNSLEEDKFVEEDEDDEYITITTTRYEKIYEDVEEDDETISPIVRAPSVSAQNPTFTNRTGSISGRTTIPEASKTTSQAPGARTPKGDITRSNVGGGGQVRTGIKSLLPIALILLAAIILYVLSKKDSKKKVKGLVIILSALSLGLGSSMAAGQNPESLICTKTIELDGKSYTLYGQVIVNEDKKSETNTNNSENIITPIITPDAVNIKGRAVKADDPKAVIAGVNLDIYDGNVLLDTIKTDNEGRFETFLLPGNYDVKVSREGYEPFTLYQPIRDKEDLTVTDLKLVTDTDSEIGKSKITIKDAKTGGKLPNTKLNVRRGWNAKTGEIVDTAVTDKNGVYDFKLKPGNYTIETQRDGYVNSYINIVAYEDNDAMQYAAITQITDDDSYTIVLEWGEDPTDLDAYVEGHSVVNDKNIKVFFGNVDFHNGKNDEVTLDRDDRKFFGPETMTIHPVKGSTYHYYVKNYKKGKIIDEARVAVYKGGDLKAQYFIPKDPGNKWDVFEIDKDGRFIPINKVIDEGNPAPENKPIFRELKSTIKDRTTGEAIKDVDAIIYKDDEVYSQFKTNDDGGFDIQIEPGTYKIRLSKEGYETLEDELIIPADGPIDTDKFSLVPITKPYDKVNITGFVRDKEEQGIDKVNIKIYQEGEVLFTEESNPDGSIDFRLKPGNYIAEFKKDGYKTSTKTLNIIDNKPGHDLNVILEELTYDFVDVEITILDADDLNNLRVLVDNKDSHQAENKVFNFTIAPGNHNFTYMADNYQPKTIKYDIPKNKDSYKLSFYLFDDEKNIETHFKIQEADQPLENKTIFLKKDQAYFEGKTNSDGKFVLDLNPGTWTLTMDNPAYSDFVEEIEIQSKPGIQTKVIEAKKNEIKPVTYKIRTEDPNGESLEGIRILLKGLGDNDTNIDTTTPESGDLILPLIPGKYWIKAETTDGGSQSDGFTVTAGEEDQGKTFVFARPGNNSNKIKETQFVVKVVDQDNEAIEGVEVLVSSFFEDPPIEPGLTNKDGIATFTLPEASYFLDTYKDGYHIPLVSYWPEIDFTKPRNDFQIRMKEEILNSTNIEGRVTDDKNNPVDKFTIHIVDGEQVIRSKDYEFTDGSYNFYLETANLGERVVETTLRITADGYIPKNIPLKFKRNIETLKEDIVLEKMDEDTSALVDAVVKAVDENGNPIENVIITVESNAYASGTSETGKYEETTDNSGEARFKLKDNDRYIVSGKHDRYYHGSVTPWLVTNGNIEPINYTLNMASNPYEDVKLTGNITTDNTSYRVKDVKIEFFRNDSLVHSYTTNGGIIDSSIAPGSYKVRMSGPFVVEDEFDIDIAYDAKTYDISRQLTYIKHDPVEVTFRAIDKVTKEPIAGLTFEMEYLHGDGEKKIPVTDENGEVTLLLRPRSMQYMFIVTADGYGRNMIQQKFVDGDYKKELDIWEFDPQTYTSTSINGRVVDDTGSPIKEGVVTATGPDGSNTTANIYNGKYELRVSPPADGSEATYHLFATSVDYESDEADVIIKNNRSQKNQNFSLKRIFYDEVNLTGWVNNDLKRTISKYSLEFSASGQDPIPAEVNTSYKVNLKPGTYTATIKPMNSWDLDYEEKTFEVNIEGHPKNQKLDFVVPVIVYPQVTYNLNVRAAGSPLKDADVKMVGRQTGNVINRKTDNNGNISVTVAPETYDVSISKDLYDTENLVAYITKYKSTYSNNVNLTYRGYDKVNVNFKVYERGTDIPLDNAKIELLYRDEVIRTIEQENGLYRLTDIEPGNNYYARVTHPDYDVTTSSVIIKKDSKEQEDRLNVNPKQALNLYFRDNSTNSIINRVDVELRQNGKLIASGQPGLTGSFNFIPKSGDYEIKASHQFYEDRSFLLTENEYKDKTSFEYKLIETKGRVSGAVSTLNGLSVSPISGAKVTAYKGNDEVKTFTSIADGTFDGSINNDNYRFVASADGYLPLTIYHDVRDDDNKLEPFRLLRNTNNNSINVSGKLVDAYVDSGAFTPRYTNVRVTANLKDVFDTNANLADTTLVFKQDGKTIKSIRSTTKTMSFDLDSGVYDVEVRKAGYKPINSKLAIPNTSPSFTTTINMDKDNRNIGIRFVDGRTGNPMTNPIFDIAIESMGQSKNYTYQPGNNINVEADGSDIRIIMLDNHYMYNDIIVSKKDYLSRENYVIEIPVYPANTSITGTILQDNGPNITYIDKAKVEVIDNKTNKVVSRVNSDANGRVNLRLMAGESYTIKAIHPSYRIGDRSIDVNLTTANSFTMFAFSDDNNKFDNSNLVWDDFEFTPANPIIENPVLKQNAPISGARINVREGWNNLSSAPITSTTTATDGSYSFSVKPGYYTLEFIKDGFVTNSFNITTYDNNNGSSNQVDFALLKTTTYDRSLRFVLNELEKTDGNFGYLEFTEAKDQTPTVSLKSNGNTNPLLYRDNIATYPNRTYLNDYRFHQASSQSMPKAIMTHFDRSTRGNIDNVNQVYTVATNGKDFYKVDVYVGNKKIKTSYKPYNQTTWEALRFTSTSYNDSYIID